MSDPKLVDETLAELQVIREHYRQARVMVLILVLLGLAVWRLATGETVDGVVTVVIAGLLAVFW